MGADGSRPSAEEVLTDDEWEARSVTEINGNGTLGTSLPREEISLSADDQVAVRELPDVDGYEVYVL